MQKTLDILEKNVQWIVLGIAALFLIWAAYAYVLTPPATVKIGSQVATADNVAVAVQQTANKLDRQIKESKPVSFPTPDLVTDWQHHMNNPFAIELARGWIDSPPDMQGETAPTTNGLQGPHIAELPKLPPAVLQAVAVGLSSVDPQAPNIPQNAAPAGNGNAQPAAQPQTKDVAWVTVPAVIAAGPFKDAMLAPFKGAQVPPQFNTIYNTTLLQVVLERQQSNGVDANGAPTFPAPDSKNTTVIGPLIADKTFAQSLPDKTAKADAGYQFIQWAQQNQGFIATPAFYRVEKGDQWQAPQLPAPGQNGAAAPGANPPTTAPNAAPAAQVAPAPMQPNPAEMRTKDAATSAEDRFLQNRRWSPFGGGRGMMPQQGMNPGGGNGNAVINPFAPTDILIWATDETATPGLTYRYRILYVMKNPVFGSQNIAPPNLTGQLAIDSPPSNWSDPIKVPPTTKFWVAGVPGRDSAQLDVFQYKDGDWNKTNPKLSPGDEVPGTDLTLVDVRSDEAHSHDRYVLLTSNTGDMIRRDAKQDESDPDHQQMLNPNGQNGQNGPNGPPPGALGREPLPPRSGFRGRMPPGGFRPPAGGGH